MDAEAAIQECKNRVRGEVLCPTDDGYEVARKVFNAMIDKRPVLIARCAGAADVIECVRFAREHDLVVSVRGGGHSVAGWGTCDGGLMIDLSRMKGIRVDPARRTVRAEVGLTLGEFDRETQAFGLATTLGAFSTTGIAGLTLGGGLGWLMGKYGLACDNLLSVDVVTAEGRLLTASATENEDLFWGVRGGSGNFGIVTSFEYRLHPVGPVVLAGGVFYPEASAKAFLRFYREFTSSCPDELTTQGGILTTLDGNRTVAMAGCYCGPIAEGEKIVKPLRTFATPLADLFAPMPYVDLQRMLDAYYPPGRQNYWKSNFLRALSDEAIDAFVECAARRPSPQMFNTSIWLEHMHGVAARVGVTETAFPHRQHPYNFSIFSIWPDPTHSAEMMAWTRQSWDALRPFMASGAYVNYLEEEGDPAARAAYGVNYERLVALKTKYDPTNFFRINHNIRPTV
jgi:FAD binding domain/Berberine and berberine like